METITQLIRKVNEELNLFKAGYGLSTYSTSVDINKIAEYINSEEPYQYFHPFRQLLDKLKAINQSKEMICRNVTYLSRMPEWIEKEINRLSEEYSGVDDSFGTSFDSIDYEITDEERKALDLKLRSELLEIQSRVELILQEALKSKGLYKQSNKKPKKLTRASVGFLVQMLIRTNYIKADSKNVLAEKFGAIFDFSPMQLAEDIGTQVLYNPSVAKITLQHLEDFIIDLQADLNTQKSNLQ